MSVYRNYLIGFFAVGLAVTVMAVPSSAIIINHGDIMSANYTFVDLTEDTLESTPFYGSFSTSGDTLIVDPAGFGVQVNPGPGVDFLDSELEMMIIPKNASSSVDIISFSESGDYTNNILAGSTASVSASAPYFWQITEVDGSPLSQIISGNGIASFTSSTNATAIWTNAAELDLSAALDATEAERGVTLGDRITKVNFRFDNSLSAQAGENATAFLKKKEAGGIQIGVSTVPEPGSATLLLFSLIGWFKLRR